MMLIGCAKDFRTSDGVVHEPKGLFNQAEKNPCLKYRIVPGNVLWAIMFFEVLIPTVYLVGWRIEEPYSYKQSCVKKAEK